MGLIVTDSLVERLRAESERRDPKSLFGAQEPITPLLREAADRLEECLGHKTKIALTLRVAELEEALRQSNAALREAERVMVHVDPTEGDNWKQYRYAIDLAREAFKGATSSRQMK